MAEGSAVDKMAEGGAVDKMAEGVGRSKREAKHDAAANIEDILQEHIETILTSNAVADLMDLCRRENHPMPSFDLVQHAGTPEAPQFTFECRVDSIMRYATASTKRAARELAAQELIKIIRQVPAAGTSRETSSVDQVAKELEELNLKKIKNYRKYTESDIKSSLGTLIINRHNFFKNLELEKKEKAYHIFNDQSITSSKVKVDLVLKAFEILYKVEEIPAVKWGSMLFIELYCDLDVVFAGKEESIYDEMIEYFQDMLQ